MIKISNICLHQNSIFIKFLKILKIHEFFCENPRIIFVLFYNVHKENMLTINLEDGREAPYKASICIFLNPTLRRDSSSTQIRILSTCCFMYGSENSKIYKTKIKNCTITFIFLLNKPRRPLPTETNLTIFEIIFFFV